MPFIPTFRHSFNDLYHKPIDELKRSYIEVVINKAICIWARSGEFTEDQITEKIDELQCFLERTTKSEFIAVYKYYMTKRCDERRSYNGNNLD